jgi:hypothetical protein
MLLLANSFPSISAMPSLEELKLAGDVLVGSEQLGEASMGGSTSLKGLGAASDQR